MNQAQNTNTPSSLFHTNTQSINLTHQQSQINFQSEIITQSSKENTHHNFCQKQQQKQQQNRRSSQTIEKTLSKLRNFIKFHNITSQQIWGPKRQIKIKQFTIKFNDNFGYYITNKQLTALLMLSNNKNQSLKVCDFKVINIWNDQNQNDGRYVNYKQYLQTQQLKRVKSNRNNGNSRVNKINMQKKNSQIIYYQTQKQNSQNSRVDRTTFVKEDTHSRIVNSNILDSFNVSKKYSQSRLQIKVDSLKRDIEEKVLQKKWDFIVMAGEMNQWIEQLRKKIQKNDKNSSQSLSSNHLTNFSAYKYKVLNSTPVTLIQQHIQTLSEQIIPEVVFIKKYETLKKKILKKEQLGHKNNLKGTVLMVLQENDKLNKSNLQNRLNQRDNELNLVLLQVMRMKSMFEWQTKILKQAGVNQ